MKGKVVADISPKEREHGLIYTAFSRVTKFCDFGLINGITRDRLVNKIYAHAKMKPRMDAEQRLSIFAELTSEKFEALLSNI